MEDVVDLCRGQIAKYKLPREVHFVAEEEMPRSTSGKVIRQQLEERLKLEA
jgi:fatty-acyl-CoA synthase